MTSAFWTPIAVADKRTCTIEEARSAEVVATTADSWTHLHQQFERYAHCDDGAIAEGFSEAVSFLLSDRWTEIRQVDAMLASHSSFSEFVIRHIDETVPKERLERIEENAGKRCPEGLGPFCHEIDVRVIQVLPGVL